MQGLVARGLARLSLGPAELWGLWRGPLLSIIVPVYNVEQYLDECLTSLRAQYYRRVEIIVVDDGSPDDSITIAERHAAEDRRIRIVRQANAGLSAARNSGVAVSKGRFLTFVDSDDTVTLDGLANAMLVLRRTGSDFAVLPYHRTRPTSSSTPPWIRKLFAHPKRKTTLAQTPQLMVHAIACAKIYRRSFWNRAKLQFVPGMTYEDQVFTAEAYVKARSIDIVDVLAYDWRVTEDSITSVFDVSAVNKRFDAAADSLRIFAAIEGADVERANQLVTNDFASYVRAARNAEDGYLEVLYDRLPALLDVADPATVQAVAPSEVRVLFQLIRRRDTQAIHTFFARGGLSLAGFEAGVEDVGPVVYLPGWEDKSIPRETFVLTERQMLFQSSTLFAQWQAGGALELTVLAYFTNVESLAHAATGKAWLQAPGADDKYAVHLQQCDRFVGHLVSVARESSVRSLYTVVVDPAALGRMPFGEFELHLEFELFGQLRHTVVKGARAAFSAGFCQPRIVGARIWRLAGGTRLALRITPAAWALNAVTPAGSGVDATAANDDGRTKHVVLGDLNRDGENRIFIRIPGRNRPVAWPASMADGIAEAGPGLFLVRGQDGETKAAHERSIALIRSVAIDDDAERITISGSWFGEVPATCNWTLTSPQLSVTASEVRRVEDDPVGTSFAVTFALAADPWRCGAAAIALGDYRFTAQSDGHPIQIRTHQQMAGELPREFSGRWLRGMLIRVAGNNVGVRVVAPLSDVEASTFGQRQLQSNYQTMTESAAVDPRQVLFQCYAGETASDSQLSLHRAFRNDPADWNLTWAVRDHSVSLPEGATAVIIGSQQWYDAFATAKYLISNVDLPAYYAPRPGQIHVQTFHGQPFKSMGASYWRDMKQLPDYRVRAEARRRTDQWDLIVTPHEASDQFYRDEYFYDGPIFNEGLPRTDALVGPEAAESRRHTRETLGIREDQTAILYAATFRDDRTVGHLAASDVDFLDMEQFARDLGPSYVLLQRSHGAVARTNKRHGDRVGVIDVTDYPDINDLTLASDAAILDYSSLRFDYGLTQNPMIYFIPDYADYASKTRGFLFDFDSTAPGPKVSTYGELLDTVQNLAEVRRSYADQYAGFNRLFNGNHDGRAGQRLLDALLNDKHHLEAGAGSVR